MQAALRALGRLLTSGRMAEVEALLDVLPGLTPDAGESHLVLIAWVAGNTGVAPRPLPWHIHVPRRACCVILCKEYLSSWALLPLGWRDLCEQSPFNRCSCKAARGGRQLRGDSCGASLQLVRRGIRGRAAGAATGASLAAHAALQHHRAWHDPRARRQAHAQRRQSAGSSGAVLCQYGFVS